MSDVPAFSEHPASVAPAPVVLAPIGLAAPTTEDGLIADRMQFWSWFTGTTTRAAIGVAVLLIVLAYFLG